MKNGNKFYILCAAGVLLLAGCTKMNKQYSTDLTPAQVTASYDYTMNRATAVYTFLPNGFLYIDGAMMASATDEAEHTLPTSMVQNFNIGSWNAYSNPDGAWSAYFRGIRTANLFLQSSDSVNLDQYKLDPTPSAQTVYQTRLATIRNWKYEVRFLRAFFYFELVKRYGGVPIITKSLSLTDDLSDIARNTLGDCLHFITAECDSAAAVLPVTYDGDNLGRATKGAALALKSRVMLYAASDLFNTPSWANGYGHPELISLTQDRVQAWTAAAAAAKAVIDMGAYSLSNSYGDLFGSNNFNNNEVILAQRNGASNSFEMASYPAGYPDGQSGTTPSQNQVDAYEMADGTAFDWSDPAEAADPYNHRDPRLAMSVITNNSSFAGRQVQAWTGGLNGPAGVAQATRTGYYLRKYVDSTLDLLQGRTSVHSWVLIRLADIYLNYAEALNESDPGNGDVATYVNMVRARAGMPPLPTGLSQSAMRTRIRNERRVELAFEDQRAWDTRRWMTAVQDLGAPLRGVQITKSGSNTFLYQVDTVEDRVFTAKMYFYPIPQSELFIAKGWSQNPLW